MKVERILRLFFLSRFIAPKHNRMNVDTQLTSSDPRRLLPHSLSDYLFYDGAVTCVCLFYSFTFDSVGEILLINLKINERERAPSGDVRFQLRRTKQKCLQVIFIVLETDDFGFSSSWLPKSIFLFEENRKTNIWCDYWWKKDREREKVENLFFIQLNYRTDLIGIDRSK